MRNYSGLLGYQINDLVCILSKYIPDEPDRICSLLFSDTNEQITHRDKSQPENNIDDRQIKLIVQPSGISSILFSEVIPWWSDAED